MPTLVLDLGNQNGFAFQTRGPADPIALGQHAHNFAVRMLADLAHQGFSVGVRHPILRLNFAIGINHGIELGLRSIKDVLFICRQHCTDDWAIISRAWAIRHIEGLGVHGDSFAAVRISYLIHKSNNYLIFLYHIDRCLSMLHCTLCP